MTIVKLILKQSNGKYKARKEQTKYIYDNKNDSKNIQRMCVWDGIMTTRDEQKKRANTFLTISNRTWNHDWRADKRQQIRGVKALFISTRYRMKIY